MTGVNKLRDARLAWAGLLLLALLGLLSIFGVGQLWRSLLAGVAYYAVPTGVGLLFLPGAAAWRAAGLREGERLLAAYFAGLVATTLLYVIRDRYGLVLDSRYIVDLFLLCLSVVGWTLSWRPAVSKARLLLTSQRALVAFAVYLVGYGVQFFVLSDYPRTDLFQFTHILKGTEEFLRFDRLNPFVADSYIPAIQVMLRLVTELTEAETFPAIWVISLCSFVIRWSAIFLMVRRLPHMRRYAGLVAAVTLPFFGVGIPTNGEIASLGACLVLGLTLASMQQLRKTQRWWLMPVVLLSVMLAISLSSAVDVAYYGVVVLIAALVTSGLAVHANNSSIFVLGFVCFLLTPLHRATVVFFSIAVISAAGLVNLAGYYWLSRRMVVGVLLLVVAVVVAVLLRASDILSIPDVGVNVAKGAKEVLGLDFISDINRSAGVGSKVAVFEVSRAVGLLLFCLGFIGLLRGQLGRSLLIYQFVAGGLLLLMVLGLPFAYRSAFFLPVLLACIAAHQFRRAAPILQRVTTHTIFAYLIGLLIVSAMIQARGGVAAGNQSRMALVLLGIATVTTVALFVMRARRMAEMMIFAVTLGGAILVERQFIRAQFMHYAYPGSSYSPSRAISHYDTRDIEIAKSLKKVPGEVVVISDPLTMANMRGLGGHNSLLLFTNLDTGSTKAKQALHHYLKNLGHHSDSVSCPSLSETLQVLASGQAPDLTYVLMRRKTPDISSKNTLYQAGYSNSLTLVSTGRPMGVMSPHGDKSIADWIYMIDLPVLPNATEEAAVHFAVVMTQRTFAWMATDVPVPQTYFATNYFLNNDILGQLRLKCGATVTDDSAILLFNLDGTVWSAP